MQEELQTILEMKSTYESQLQNLKERWKNGTSSFCKKKDYQMQVDIWEKRIAEYEDTIEKLKKRHL